MLSIKAIKSRLNLAAACICTISLITVTLGYSIISYYLVLNHSQDNLLKVSEKYAYEMSTWIGTQSTMLHSIKEDIEISGNLNKYVLQNYLWRKAHLSGGIVSDYYIGLSDNSFISGTRRTEQINDHFIDKEWYKTAIESQSLIYLAPYVDEKSGKTLLTLAEPLMINNQVTGVIAADIIIDDLINTVNYIRIAPNSYAFLLDADKGFITHIRSDFLPTAEEVQSLNKVMNGRFREVGDQIDYPTTSISTAKDFDTLYKYFVTSKIDKVNWTLAFAVPRRELTKELLILLTSFIAICFAAIIFSVLAIIITSHLLFKREKQPKKLQPRFLKDSLKRNY